MKEKKNLFYTQTRWSSFLHWTMPSIMISPLYLFPNNVFTLHSKPLMDSMCFDVSQPFLPVASLGKIKADSSTTLFIGWWITKTREHLRSNSIAQLFIPQPLSWLLKMDIQPCQTFNRHCHLIFLNQRSNYCLCHAYISPLQRSTTATY